MADTRPNIDIPANTYVDIYAALNAQQGFPSVPVGTQIRIQLLGDARVHVIVRADEPTNLEAYQLITTKSVYWENDSGDSGAWAYAFGRTEINVEVV